MNQLVELVMIAKPISFASIVTHIGMTKMLTHFHLIVFHLSSAARQLFMIDAPYL